MWCGSLRCHAPDFNMWVVEMIVTGSETRVTFEPPEQGRNRYIRTRPLPSFRSDPKIACGKSADCNDLRVVLTKAFAVSGPSPRPLRRPSALLLFGRRVFLLSYQKT